jgi:hypothetical protein
MVIAVRCGIMTIDAEAWMTEARDPGWYLRTVQMFQLLLNSAPAQPGFVAFFQQWGTHG